MVNSASDVSLYMYGGKSRDNASIAVTPYNESLVVGKTYSVDISADAILLIVPNYNKSSNTTYSISYSISGEEYSYWQKLIMGPNGFKYFIIALVCAGVIGLIILVVIILVIVKFCCKKKG